MSQSAILFRTDGAANGTLLLVVEYFWSFCLFRQYCSTRKQTKNAFSGTSQLKKEQEQWNRVQ